jgi:hypothetical protein
MPLQLDMNLASDERNTYCAHCGIFRTSHKKTALRQSKLQQGGTSQVALRSYSFITTISLTIERGYSVPLGPQNL